MSDNFESNVDQLVSMLQIERFLAEELLNDSEGDVSMAVNHYLLTKEDLGTVDPNIPSNSASQRSQGVASVYQQMKGNTPDDDNDDVEEEGQAFFVGGGRGGGQQVLGPPKKRSDADKLVKHIFRSAKEHGAQELPTHLAINPNVASSSGAVNSFSGSGYKLGDSAGIASEQMNTTDEASHTRGKVRINSYSVILKMWQNGISMNDDTFMSYNSPETLAFLQEVRSGSIPRSIIRQAGGRVVDLQMEDHHFEDYQPPPMKPFSGAGLVLGVPTPTVATETPEDSMGSPLPNLGTLRIDESVPTTRIRVRLVDGTALVAVFNVTHTVNDIRNYIRQEHGPSRSRNFVLLTSYPQTEISDESISLQDANLQSASIMQRWI